MNKRAIGFVLTFGIVYLLSAQSLDTFNSERLDLNRKGMLVLSSWALANIISSPLLASRSSGSAKYFHQMNGYWNGVNLLIGGIGYYTAMTGDHSGLSIAETLKEQHRIEKILLLNTGLDVAYVTAGFFLKERGWRKESERLKGFGNSLMLQGVFLFAFDLAFYFVHASHSKELNGFLRKLAVSPNGIGMAWMF